MEIVKDFICDQFNIMFKNGKIMMSPTFSMKYFWQTSHVCTENLLCFENIQERKGYFSKCVKNWWYSIQIKDVFRIQMSEINCIVHKNFNSFIWFLTDPQLPKNISYWKQY